MWSRVVEIMLGCWLAVSPFVFRHAADETQFWINDFSCATAVMTLAMLSCWKPTRHAHVGIVLVGIWMIVFAYQNFPEPAPPALQNSALIGFLLIMFGVIPNDAAFPPVGWQEYDRKCEESNE